MNFNQKESSGRTRNVPILFWVTEEEKKMIRKKMILSKTSNMSAYLRKAAIDCMSLPAYPFARSAGAVATA